MFIRKRNSNWSIERAIYKPAVKDKQGTIITHPVRTTDYVGSVKSYTCFASVSPYLLEKLSDEEKTELQEALKENEPKSDYWLDRLASSIRYAAGEIKTCVDISGGSDMVTRKQLEAKIKAIDDAWLHFFQTAQAHGLKRKARGPAKAPPSPDKGSSPGHS